MLYCLAFEKYVQRDKAYLPIEFYKQSIIKIYSDTNLNVDDSRIITSKSDFW